MSAALETLTAQADAIHARYRRGFAGKNRATRDLAVLDGILAEMRDLLAQLPADAGGLRGTVEEWVRLYGSEREAIASVQAAGPDAVRAWRLVEWSDVTFYRYLRQFAGKNRSTRDGWLIAEMSERQAKWANELDALAARLGDAKLTEAAAQVRTHLDTYRGEAKAIPAARVALPATERARLLATLANGQFAEYRRHFAEKARLSRRIALLRRITGALEEIQREMGAVRDLGVRTPSHLDNLVKVTDRVKHHQSEISAVHTARRDASAAAIALALGDDANAVFNEYRSGFANKSRATVDPARLGELCDRLHEIAAAMDELQAERPDATNQKNVEIVIETLKAYEREFRAIEAAKKAS